jgi:hypothetical protein
MPTTAASRDCDKEATLAKEPDEYTIVIKGHLPSRRFQRFEDLVVTHQPNGETRLVGSMHDQSALFGLLNWIHDLGAVLVSVRRRKPSDQ